MLSVGELKKLTAEEEIETILAVFPDYYGRLVGKRFQASFFIDDVLGHGAHACDYLLACDMEMDPVPGYEYTSWEHGYGDIRLQPDLNTLRRASWLDRSALVICDVLSETDGSPVAVAPRNILRRQIERAREQRFTAVGASELELYVFSDSYDEIAAKNFVALEPIGRYSEDYHMLQSTKEEPVIAPIRHHLERSGIPVESSKGEWGAGQQEIGIRYSELLEMADRHTIYKQAAKEIAWSLGRAVTFMAKWDERYAGSSMHIHVSLRDAGGKSLFAGDHEFGGVQVSSTFLWFLGGWMKHIRELFSFYAPYPTSYKRYVAGSFAPTAIACSYDNRTAGFRIVGEGESLRIECRAAGADANPYLAFAATLAAGLEGIEQQIDPPPMFEGDLYAAKELPQVPQTLRESIAALEESQWARKVFGDKVIDHYLHFLNTEQRKFDEVVTDWERRRYFERA
jgi:glutamine synthetase